MVRPPLPVLLVAVVAVLISLVPIVYLLVRVSEIGIAGFFSNVLQSRTLELVVNSLALALAVSVCAVVFGSLQAWVAIRSNLPGRSLFAVLAALPLAIPSYVSAYSWVAIIPGFSGFWAAWLLLTIGTTPLVYLAVSASLTRFDSSTEEVASSLGLGRFAVLRRVTWPNIRPAAIAGGLLSALYVLSDFGAVSIVRFDSFTRAIYNAYRSSFDRNAAASLALVLVLVTLAILLIESKARGGFVSGVSIANRLNKISLGPWKIPTLALLSGFATLGLLIPIASLIRWSMVGFSTTNWDEVFRALLNSSALAISGGLLTGLLAVIVAIVVVRYSFKFSWLMDRAVWVTHAMPGIVVALSLVFLANAFVPAIYQTTLLVLIAYVALFLPNALSAMVTPLSQSPKTLDEVAASLGLKKIETLRKVVLPIAGPGIFAGTALVVLTVLKELPVTLLLRPTGIETLATRLWSETGVGAFSAAAPYALLLVVLAGFPAWALNRSIRKDLLPGRDLERV
jgi:iron(III) transport system permease protein